MAYRQMAYRQWKILPFIGGVVFCLTVDSGYGSDLTHMMNPPIEPNSPLTSLSPWKNYSWEFRAGAYAHDLTSQEHTVADLSLEVLSPTLYRPTQAYIDRLSFRMGLGGTANFRGKTSIAYLDFVSDLDITNEIFIESSIGGAFNTGDTGVNAHVGHNPMGCSVGFHESISLGYKLTEQWTAMASGEHASNAGLCSHNRGVTNYGGRLAYSF